MAGSAFLLLKLTLVWLLLGLGLPAQEPEPQISGRVTEAKNGSPIEGAIIRLIPPFLAGQANFQTATTNSNGEYRFPEVREGSYLIEASRDGFVSLPYKRNVPEGVFQRFDSSTRLAGVDFRLNHEAVISGTVTNSEGQPVAAVSVAVVPREPNGSVHSLPLRGVKTDSGGHFVFKGLPASAYFVCVNGPHGFNAFPSAGVWYRERWFRNAYSSEAAVPITVTEGEEHGGVLMTVEREKRFNVIVWPSGPDGTAKPDRYDVMLEHRNHSSTRQPDGSYLIPAIPAGHYTLVSTAWSGTQYVGQGESSFDVNDQDVNVHLQVGGLGQIEGQVKSAGAAVAASSMIRINSDEAGQSVPIDAQGHFVFPRVLPARYKFKLFPSAPGVVLRSATCDGKEVTDQLLLQVGDRQKVSCELTLATP